MKVTIKKHKVKPFPTEEGEVEYHWYDAVTSDTNRLINFGSRDGGHSVGEELDLDIVVYTRNDVKDGWKELTEK